jgi:hypothetical protein
LVWRAGCSRFLIRVEVKQVSCHGISSKPEVLSIV